HGEDAVHPLEARDHAAFRWHRRAGGVRAASARDQRHAMRVAQPHQFHDLLVVARIHYRIRHRLPARVVVAVGQALAGIDAHRVAEDAPQSGVEVRFGHGGRACQSTYSKTLTTRSTPATLRAISTTASSSSRVTLPIRYTVRCAVVTL